MITCSLEEFAMFLARIVILDRMFEDLNEILAGQFDQVDRVTERKCLSDVGKRNRSCLWLLSKSISVPNIQCVGDAV